MVYFSPLQLQEEFGTKGLPRDFSPEQFDQVYNRTQRFVDSYLRSGGIKAPLSDPEAIEIVRGACMDIARYYAWSDQPSDHIKDRFEKAEKWLTQVASGKVRIVTQVQESKKSGFHTLRIIRS